MSLLQIFFIISGIIISIFAIEIAKKQKFNALHFFVFIFIGFGLLAFTFFPSVLNVIGRIFGLQRGADLLVYTSIVFLVYFVLLLLRKIEQNKSDLTSLIRNVAINNSVKKIIKGKEVILVRAYNEVEVIENTLKSIKNAGFERILLVNDGSTDNTLNKISSLEIEDFVVLNHLLNRGAGAALETGFEYLRKYSQVDYVITFDADGQHDVEDLKNISYILNEYKDIDVFIGSRFLGKKQVGIPFLRKIVLKLGIVFTFFISNIKLSDSHNGFRVFRKGVLDKIKLTIDDMGYASELIDIISSKKIPYKEIPVNIKYSDYSIYKGQKNSNAFKIALKIIRSKFFK